MYQVAGTSGANILALWTLSAQIGQWSVVAGGGRLPGNTCLRMAVAGNPALVKTMDSQPTWGIAFGLKQSIIQPNVAIQVCGFQDASTVQMDLRTNLDGTLSATRNGTVLGTSTVALGANAWNHIEYKVTFHSSAGVIQLWINGVQQFNLTGQNTRATANNSANQVFIGNFNGGNAANYDFDDVIAYDAQPNDANGFADITGPIGDCSLNWLLPTGAGSTTQWTPDSGSNYARVNEATPDGDTSYVQDATVGDIDTYATADLPAGTATVKSIAVCNYARKTDTGSRTIVAEIRSGGTNYAHTIPIPLAQTYAYGFSNWGMNPSGGGVAWTPTSVNALEVGQKVNS